jgi:hypothetical protein
MKPIVCAWHQCAKEFQPQHPRETFCCPACRRARGRWKAARGGPLVDLLLTEQVEALMDAKRRIQKEITDAKNTP